MADEDAVEAALPAVHAGPALRRRDLLARTRNRLHRSAAAGRLAAVGAILIDRRRDRRRVRSATAQEALGAAGRERSEAVLEGVPMPSNGMAAGASSLTAGRCGRRRARSADGADRTRLPRRSPPNGMRSATKIDPRTMPLTGLANAAIDRIAPDTEAFAQGIARLWRGRPACYRAEGPSALVERQDASVGPAARLGAAALRRRLSHDERDHARRSPQRRSTG